MDSDGIFIVLRTRGKLLGQSSCYCLRSHGRRSFLFRGGYDILTTYIGENDHISLFIRGQIRWWHKDRIDKKDPRLCLRTLGTLALRGVPLLPRSSTSTTTSFTHWKLPSDFCMI